MALAEPETGPLVGVQLVCVAGSDLGQTFPLTHAKMLIGRANADVSLRGADVSRTHARISRSGGRFWIEDLHSSHGTYVNGTPITGETELRFGDRLQLGSTILVFGRQDALEERLRQYQKLEAMGALVKGIAHDFNNTLQAMLGSIERLQSLATTAPMHAVLDDMVRTTSSASGLVRRLLRIGRNKPATLDLVELDVIVRNSVAMATRASPANVRIDVVGAAEVLLRGSCSELEQALLNVLANARDAMPDGGTIVVTTNLITLDRTAAHTRHLPGEGTFVEVVVRDEGIGMDQQTMERAFEPFFTTKTATGTGLGLAMLYSTVKNHGGTASLHSEVGKGSTVTITLPVVA